MIQRTTVMYVVPEGTRESTRLSTERISTYTDIKYDDDDTNSQENKIHTNDIHSFKCKGNFHEWKLGSINIRSGKEKSEGERRIWSRLWRRIRFYLQRT